MKVTIVAHKLGLNYGGILQAYALQVFIRRMGHEVTTTDFQEYPKVLGKIKTTLGRSLRTKRLYVHSTSVQSIIGNNTQQFINREMTYVDGPPASLEQADLLIVGSDQVWRAAYVDPVRYMFGDIKDTNVKRISYAASFGTNDLREYTQVQVKATAKLAQKFSAISVREASGVDICKKYWDVEALHHVDPTLLLNAEDYSKAISTGVTEQPAGSLFVYVLDRSVHNDEIINKVEALSGTKKFELMPKEYVSFVDFLRDRKAHTMPGVEQWLRSYRDAEYVVTDSFHGTVFSIIFNKPFISIGNEGRGLARFTSLLGMFGLEDRMVSNASQVTQKLLETEINWRHVNAVIKKEQKRSYEYLQSNLS